MLQASRETDLKVAEKLFSFVEEPERWTSKGETWFWVHPTSGILIGHPYTFDLMDGEYAHSWTEFRPSKNMIDAQVLLDWYHERNKPITITNTLNVHGADWYVTLDFGKIVSAATLELAICKAVLNDNIRRK